MRAKLFLKNTNYKLRAFTQIVAFVALVIFGFAPLIVSYKTLNHMIFDLMIMDYQDVMDLKMFPLIKGTSSLILIIIVCRCFSERQSFVMAIKQNSVWLIFAALLLWMTISVHFINGVTDDVIHGVGLKHETFQLHIVYYLGFGFLGFVLSSSQLKMWLFRIYLAVSIILVPVAMYLFRHMYKTLDYIWKTSFECVFSNPNYYGYFLTVMTGLAAALYVGEKSPKWRLFYLAALVVNTFGLSYNDTLGAWIGSLFACLFLIVAYRLWNGRFERRTFSALFIFLIVLLLTGIYNKNILKNISSFFYDLGLIIIDPYAEDSLHAGSGRWKIWMQTLELIKRHPLFGLGFEGIHARGLSSFVGNDRPHNEYLQYAVFYGIPATLLYISACAGIYIRGLKWKERLDGETMAALVAAFGYLSGAFFGLTVYNTAPYFFIMLGLGYVSIQPAGQFYRGRL